MHLFFSGIGGSGLGPLALIAHQAGYRVSGSDKQDSAYITYLRTHGIENIEIGQTVEQITASHARDPIDWYVYSSAIAIENPDSPEFRFCHAKHIKTSKRDVLLSTILQDKDLGLIAVAGTHGKTTTTAMMIWLLQRLGIPISYSVGAKMSFGDMGHYDPASKYFIYEADEFDRNFLSFKPLVSIIVGIDYDHPDIYPTRQDYQQAFREFIGQSSQVVMWQEDSEQLGLPTNPSWYTLDKATPAINSQLHLPGPVNRQDAWQVAAAVQLLTGLAFEQLQPHLDAFPGVSRRFEQIIPGLYSDYAHTPPKIRGTIATAREVARGKDVVVVYEGLHNTRQHFIKDELKNIFNDVSKLYIVPSYLAREDKTLPLLAPADLKELLSDIAKAATIPTQLSDSLERAIRQHLADENLVVCMSSGGSGSLDEWLRQKFTPKAAA